MLAQVHAQDNIHTELVPHVPYLRTHAHGHIPGQNLYCTNGGQESEDSKSSDECYPQEDPVRYQRTVRDLNPEPESACMPTLLIADDQGPTLQIGSPYEGPPG